MAELDVSTLPPTESPTVSRPHQILTRARYAARFAWRVVVSRYYLRHCDAVGRWSRVTDGRPVIDNNGTVRLGSRIRLTASYAPIELRTGAHGVIKIGDRTAINFGCSFVSRASVSIGAGVNFGPYCVVSDCADGSVDGHTEPEPITICDGVWLASRVTVGPGSHIGEGTVVTAGSVVRGKLPGNVIAGGAPARVIRRLDREPADS
jgi:acetyltransferase-like isoleucine patch superfamily enzyme